METYRFRAAPSPTGKVHIGNIRTYLYNYLLAKKYGGVNVIRVEDTDQARKVPKGTEAMIEAYQAVGITFDEGPHVGGEYGPYVQSERLEIYKEYAHKLIESGHAYYCFCSKERLEEVKEKQRMNKVKEQYDRHCRNISPEDAQKRVDAGEPYVIRMKFPLEGSMSFVDEIYGKISINNKEIDDMVLLKTDGFPTYHFGVVVDDHLMNISHVFRGREYLTQTTRNVFLYESFGWKQPIWVHCPPILNPDGKGKLSKRFGALPAVAYLRKGYLKESIINYIMLCGWAPKLEDSHQDEIYSIEEFIKLFDISRLQKAGARFDQKKFDYINGKHIRKHTLDELVELVFYWANNYVLKEFISDEYTEREPWEFELMEKITKLLPLWKNDIEYFKRALALEFERISMLSELPESLNFFYEDITEWNDIDWNTKNHDKKELADALENILPKLEEIFKDNVFDHEIWEKVVRGYADELGWKHGDMFLAIRSATTGRLQSPPLLDCFAILTWEKTKRHILNAIIWLRK